ncbi:MAG: hypothetical protein JKX70_01145 [Phycisphaerales bacterium]|nr:hypothetical protein [Phycisphaerales bacterium]
MSNESTQVQWSESPEQYSCPSCCESASGYAVLKKEVEGDPEEMRLSLEDSPLPSEVVELDDGKGFIVVESSNIHTPACCTRVRSSRRHGPMWILCESCNSKSLLLDQQDMVSFYWRVPTQHGEVWAYNRQHLVAIREHIQLERRPQGFFKLPGWMLASKNRVEMVKLINMALNNGPSQF